MAHPRRFRFAAELSKAPDATARSWANQARKAEGLGFSSLLMPDHFGDQLAPVPALMAVADATEHLRIGTLVFDNDYRHPLVLAKEAATLDLLSDGRLELGLGRGMDAIGLRAGGDRLIDAPSVRVDRFEEAVTIVAGLLESAGPFSYVGTHYTVTDHTATPRPAQQPRPPLIIGGGGRRVLSIAGRHAEIVSINVNLHAGTGGPEAAPNATPDATRQKIQWVRDGGSRFDDIELNTLIGFFVVTDDPHSVAKRWLRCSGSRLTMCCTYRLPLSAPSTTWCKSCSGDAKSTASVLLHRERQLGGVCSRGGQARRYVTARPGWWRGASSYGCAMGLTSYEGFVHLDIEAKPGGVVLVTLNRPEVSTPPTCACTGRCRRSGRWSTPTTPPGDRGHRGGPCL